MTKIKQYDGHSPDIIDAEYCVIAPHQAHADMSVKQYLAVALLVTPIFISLLGGVFGVWSSKAAMLGIFAGTFFMLAVNSWNAPERLHPLRGTLVGLAILTVVIATTGCDQQQSTATEKKAQLEQHKAEVEQLKKSPEAFKQAFDQCGRDNAAREKAGQLGVIDYRCSAIVHAYYTQPSKGASFQGGSLDYPDGGAK